MIVMEKGAEKGFLCFPEIKLHYLRNMHFQRPIRRFLYLPGVLLTYTLYGYMIAYRQSQMF